MVWSKIPMQQVQPIFINAQNYDYLLNFLCYLYYSAEDDDEAEPLSEEENPAKKVALKTTMALVSKKNDTPSPNRSDGKELTTSDDAVMPSSHEKSDVEAPASPKDGN